MFQYKDREFLRLFGWCNDVCVWVKEFIRRIAATIVIVNRDDYDRYEVIGMKGRRTIVGIVFLIGTAILMTGCLLQQNQTPTASFTAIPSRGEAPLAVAFDASASYDPDGHIVSYIWNFGDGQDGTGAEGFHIYENAGTYTVTLTVTDDDGAMATASRVITVKVPDNIAPIVDFTATPRSGEAPLTVVLNATASSDADGTITAYKWNFGDGSPSGMGSVVTHTYSIPGTYAVVLTITDNDGAESRAACTIDVSSSGNIVPTASFTTDPSVLTFAYPPVTIAFNASSSSDPDGTILSYHWDFGDGTTSIGVTTSHTYTDPGKYIVILTVIDDHGARASTLATVRVMNLSSNPYMPYIPPINLKGGSS